MKFDSALKNNSGQLAEPVFEETPLGILLREGQSLFISGAGLGGFAETAAQIGPGRMSEVILGQVAAGPIALVFADLTTLFLYFGLSTMLLT